MLDYEALISFTTQIVSAHVSHNTVSSDQLPELIRRVYITLGRMTEKQAIPQPPDPAIPIAKSVRTDAIICLEDGQPFKMLKRHLMSDHKMTPEQYRKKWGLPPTYPMVAPTYAKVRSTLAKKIGLGTFRTGTKQRRKRKAAA